MNEPIPLQRAGTVPRPRTSEAVVDGALWLTVRDEDRDGIAELLAAMLLAALEAHGTEPSMSEARQRIGRGIWRSVYASLVDHRTTGRSAPGPPGCSSSLRARHEQHDRLDLPVLPGRAAGADRPDVARPRGRASRAWRARHGPRRGSFATKPCAGFGMACSMTRRFRSKTKITCRPYVGPWPHSRSDRASCGAFSNTTLNCNQELASIPWGMAWGMGWGDGIPMAGGDKDATPTPNPIRRRNYSETARARSKPHTAGGRLPPPPPSVASAVSDSKKIDGPGNTGTPLDSPRESDRQRRPRLATPRPRTAPRWRVPARSTPTGPKKPSNGAR